MHLTALCKASPMRFWENAAAFVKTKTFLVMKLTTILLLACCMQVCAAGYGQRVSISGQNLTLKKVFKEIQEQTGFLFFYSDSDLEKTKKISIDAQNEELPVVLNQVFQDQLLTYTIIDKTIVIKQRKVVPQATEINPQVIEVRGTVTDEKGKPVPTVSVVVTGSPIGGMTNEEGEYFLKNVPENGVLLFSFVGYESMKVAVDGRRIINVVLKVEVKQLDETIVTGYSVKKASQLTGAVQSITGEELRNGVSSANTLALLKGKTTGLYIVEPGGSVATRGQVVMRGQASFNDNSNSNFGPLIVLDGVITTSSNLQDIVNPNDIESLTVLKDAASTAIYGSRAAQGVIVVTTKRGTPGKVKLNLNMNYGKVENDRLVRFMNTQELTTHITKYMHSLYDGTPSLQSTYGSFDNYFNTTSIFKPSDLATDYQWDNNAFFTNGKQSDINLSLSSGTDKTRFYSAIDWTKQDGTLLDDNLDRKSVRFNIDQNISSRFTLTLNANALIDKYTATNSENQYYLFLPFVSPYYANGQLADSVPNYLYKASGARGTQYYDNPLYSHSYNTSITKRQNYFASGKLKYSILPWLSFQTTNSVQYANNNVNSYKDPRTYRGRYDGPASNRIFVNGAISINDARTDYFLTSNMLNFNHRFGQHALSALVGQEWGKIHTETVGVSAYNTPYPGERNLGAFQSYGTWINVLQSTPAIPSATAPIDKASFSLFGEMNENFKDKYLASASLRRDASTNFGRDNRYGTFYAFGAGWLISKENFMSMVPAITNLKLRVAYGTSGREAGADYLNFSVYTDAVRYNTTTTSGSTIQRLGNDQITWETTYTTNLGMDISFWKRINLSLDLYKRRSTDLLQTVPLPSYIGFPSQIRNIGELTNTGLEAALSTINIQSKTFSWTSEFNISFNKNRLTHIYGDSIRDGFAGTYYRYVGDDINVLRAIKYVGVNPDNGHPLFERVMGDKSVVIVDSIPLVKQDGLRGYQVVGSATPKFFGGFSNTFTYKNFSLSTLFNFSYGNIIFNNAMRNFMDPSAWQSGFNIVQPDGNVRFWQGPGDKNANYPSFTDLAFFTRGGMNINSSLLYVDASYLRLRNVRLGYEIPARLVNKAGITGINVYVSADNLFVIKSKDLFAADPEGATIGSTSTSYSGTGLASGMPRKLLFGINVGF
jgi:TonB-dependent starch-binding outer membrane protein SusC